MKKVLSILLVAVLLASMAVSIPITASAFSTDNFKAQITKISVGKPITDTDTGKKYLPVDVHIFAAEDLSDSEAVYFLEGYLKATLADGTQSESIQRLGMTLMGPLKPDVPLDSNMWSWEWTPYDTGGGQGVIKYNVPLLEDDETQAVEKSDATGMTEVNGLKVGDSFTIQNETVVNTSGFPEDIVTELFPDGNSIFSDSVTITIEDESNYPKEIIPSEEKTVTITVHYVYAEGGQAAPDKTETVKLEFGSVYFIPSPTIEGYTPDKSEIAGSSPETDLEFTVTYTKNIELPDLSKLALTGAWIDDGNHEYTEDEVKQIGLEGLTEGEDYTSTITNEKADSGENWIKAFEPIEDKSTGEREVKVKKAPETVTITVHYVYAEGGQAAPDKTETVKVEFGTVYFIPSPTIEGYTPDKSEIAGSSPDTNMEFTVTYTKDSELSNLSKLALTGAWIDDENHEYTEDEVKQIGLEGLTEGEDYTSTITTETVENGENWIKAFEPIEGKSTGEREVKVKKASETVTITVHYVYAEGGQAAPDKTEPVKLEIGSGYYIPSPTIEGYTPDKSEIVGASPDKDMEFTVTYTKNAEEPVIEPAPESKDISLDEASWTKGTGNDAEVVLKGTLKGDGWMVGDAYAKLEGPLSSQDCDAIWTGQKDVDTTITDNGDGTFSFVFSRALYWLGGKLPTASSKMTLMMSFWKDGKEYVSNQLVVGLGETAKKSSEAKTTLSIKIKKSKIYVGTKTAITTNVENGLGTTTYTTSDKKVATVSSKGVVTGKSAGKAKITVENNGVKKSVTVTVVKKANTLTVKAKTVKAKAKKKTTFAKSKIFKIQKAQGKLTFKKLKGNKKITIKKKTGKLTVKKGLKKGKTYKVKIKVTAKGNTKFNAKSKTVTIKVKVK